MSRAVLTREQQAVVDADLDGPRLVDAGAGTGKTFALVQRARALIERGVLRPDELLVATYTKAAAAEIAGRLDGALGPAPATRPTCGTFHGIAAGLLREFAYAAGVSPDVRVIDDGRARGVFARAFDDLAHDRLAVDLTHFPLLDRSKALERSLATLVLALRGRGEDIAAVLRRAREAAGGLETIAYGGVKELKISGAPRAGWPRPDPERSPAERRVEALRERANVDVVAALFARFGQLLAAEGLLTFGDILIAATRMLGDHPAIARTLRARWKHAIVDEFQDTNAVQIAFLEAIFGPDLRPVLVVGDVRQAIYEFNGAQPQGIVDFRARARESLPLSINRRSYQPILDVAQYALATLAAGDWAAFGPALDARLTAQRGDADPRCVGVELFAGENALEEEAARVADALRALVDAGVSPRACAVLVRTRMRAGIFAQAIRERGLAVQLHGGVGFFDAPEVREVVAWLRLAQAPADRRAVTAALQSASIGVSDGGVALLAGGGDLARAALLAAPPAEFDATERERLERFRRTARVVCSLTGEPLVEAVRTAVLASGAEIARAADPALLPQVRANLDKLVRFAADFAGDRPQARIGDLVAELRERDELELDLPLAEVDGESITMMTIHGAKGLEWDHVFVADVVAASFPLVNNDVRDHVAQFDPLTGALALKHGVDGRLTLRWFLTQHPHDAAGTVVARPPRSRAEEYRLLYVALTRARDAVYVSGRVRSTARPSECYSAVEQWATQVSGSSERHRFAPPRGGRQTELSLPPGLAPEVARALDARARRRAATRGALPERRGALSYTAIASSQRCPRRARYQYVLGIPDISDDAGWPDIGDDADSSDIGDDAALADIGDGDRIPGDGARAADAWPDAARYGRVVHRALELIARARITGSDPDIGRALADAFAHESWAPAAAAGSRARAAVAAAAAQLRAFTPIDAERKFELTIDGVRLGGFIDLVARDPAGQTAIVDYKTGRSSADAYALQFALYTQAIGVDFPAAKSLLLRIGDDGAALEPVVPADPATLRDAIARAKTMESDEPRPGAQCAYCPYAHDICRDAP